MIIISQSMTLKLLELSYIISNPVTYAIKLIFISTFMISSFRLSISFFIQECLLYTKACLLLHRTMFTWKRLHFLNALSFLFVFGFLLVAVIPHGIRTLCFHTDHEAACLSLFCDITFCGWVYAEKHSRSYVVVMALLLICSSWKFETLYVWLLQG